MGMLSVGPEPSVLVLDVDVVADDVVVIVAVVADVDVDVDDVVAIVAVVADVDVVAGNAVAAMAVVADVVFNDVTVVDIASDVVTRDSVAISGITSDVVTEDSVAVDDDVSCVNLLMLSILSTTISTRTITGISCICTLFTVSVSSSSMVLMNSHCSGLLSLGLDSGIDPDSVTVGPFVVAECSVAVSVVVVVHLALFVVALFVAMVVSAQTLWQLIVDG